MIALPIFTVCARNIHRVMPADRVEKSKVSEARQVDLKDRAIHASFILLMVLHPPLSLFNIKMLACRQYNDESVLKYDTATDCETSSVCMGSAITFLIFYTFGIPLLVFCTLRRYMSPAGKERFKGTATGKSAAKRLGFICGKYEPQFFYYETLEMTRKFLLVAASNTIRGTYAPLVTKFVITSFFFVVLVKTAPFNSPLLDTVVQTSHFCSMMTLFFGLLSAIDFWEDEGIDETIPNTIIMIIMFMPLFVAFYIVGLAMWEISRFQAKALKVKTLKMRVKLAEKRKEALDAVGRRIEHANIRSSCDVHHHPPPTEAEAAKNVQRVFRGHKARKHVRANTAMSSTAT